MFLAHLLDGSLNRLFEAWFAAIKVVKTTGDFTSQLNVGDLICTHRYLAGTVSQNIGRLQQRVAEEPIGAQVFFTQFFLLVFIGRHPFQPG